MFCDYCGAELSPNAAACLECGRRTAPFRALPPADAVENLRRQWITYCRVRLYGGLLLTLQILGWLHMIDSRMKLLNARANGRGELFEHPAMLNVALAVLFFVGILGIVWAIVGFAGTRGLAQRSAAGRRRASLMAALTLLDVPFGTVLAILVLRAIARVDPSQPPKATAASQ
jgi:hypothetical protein